MFDIDFLRCLVSDKLGSDYKLASYYEQINDDSEIDRYIETYKAIINDENNVNNKAWGVIRQEGNSEITNLYYNYVISFDWSIYFKCKQKDRDSVLIDLNKFIKENKALNYPMIQTDNGAIYNYKSAYYRDITTTFNEDTWKKEEKLRNIIKYENDYSGQVVLRVPTTDSDGNSVYDYFQTLSDEEKNAYIQKLFNQYIGYYNDKSIISEFNFNIIKNNLKNCFILIADLDNDVSYEYKVLEPKNVGKCIKIIDYTKSLYTICGEYQLYKINLAFNSIESSMPKILNGDEICDIYLSGTSTLCDSTLYMGSDLLEETLVFNSGTKAYNDRIETLDLSNNGALDYETNRTRASGYGQDLFITAKSNEKKLSIVVNYDNDSEMYFYNKFTSMKYENEDVNVVYKQSFKKFDENYTYVTSYIGKIIGGEVSNTNGDVEILTLTLQVRS